MSVINPPRRKPVRALLRSPIFRRKREGEEKIRKNLADITGEEIDYCMRPIIFAEDFKVNY